MGLWGIRTKASLSALAPLRGITLAKTPRRKVFFVLIAAFILTGCEREENIKGFTFNSAFGYRNSDPESSYSIIGSGSMFTAHSENADSLLKAWIKSHPNAVLKQVSSIATPQINSPDQKMIYCWIFDGPDTLNNYLVKQGCYAAAAMNRPQTWEEMSAKEKEGYNERNRADVTVSIDKAEYTNFVQQIGAAEESARKNKRGIWSRKNIYGVETP